jgi:hypothetical protein
MSHPNVHSRRKLLARAKRARKLTPKQRVLRKYPAAFYHCLGTVPHHRIVNEVKTDGWASFRQIGSGLTPRDAWADALRRIDSGKATNG